MINVRYVITANNDKGDEQVIWYGRLPAIPQPSFDGTCTIYVGDTPFELLGLVFRDDNDVVELPLHPIDTDEVTDVTFTQLIAAGWSRRKTP